jgi:CBS domain-containing protein
MKVTELMTRAVVSVHEGEGLDQAVRLMREHECGCLPVVDERQRVTAVLTDRDVCLAALREGKPLSSIRVHAAASPRAFACRADDTVAEAERLMGQHQVRRLPVVDAEDRLVGVLSLDDIAREAFREDELIARPVSARAVGITLGQIARPHLISEAGA